MANFNPMDQPIQKRADFLCVTNLSTQTIQNVQNGEEIKCLHNFALFVANMLGHDNAVFKANMSGHERASETSRLAIFYLPTACVQGCRKSGPSQV